MRRGPHRLSISALALLALGPTAASGRSGAEAPSHVLLKETARTLERGRATLSGLPKLPRQPISLSRNDVVFREFGHGLRGGYGLADRTELRLDAQWITFAGSGHSGQFDLAAGVKRELLSDASSGLRISLFPSVSGTKVMGRIPAYRASVSAPLTLERGPLELSLSPRVPAGIAAAARVALAPQAELFAESESRSLWAGVALMPLPAARVPIVLLSRQDPSEGPAFGLVAVTLQVAL